MKKDGNIVRYTRSEIEAMEDKTRPDAPPGPSLGADFWADAKLVYPKPPKRQLTLRLDAEVVDWFKAQGRGYQSLMNEVLKSYVEAAQPTRPGVAEEAAPSVTPPPGRAPRR